MNTSTTVPTTASTSAPKRSIPAPSPAPVPTPTPAAPAAKGIVEQAEHFVAQVSSVYRTALEVWGVLKPLVVPMTLVLVCFLVAIVVIQSALFIGHIPFVPTILQTAGLVLVFRKGRSYLFSEGRAGYAMQLGGLYKRLIGNS